MPVEVIMPRLGLTMTEGTILQWFKNEGDEVTKGEPLFEVETDKVALQVETPESGILSKIVVQTGGTAELSEVIAYIGQPGEQAGFKEAPLSEPSSITASDRPKKSELEEEPAGYRLAASGLAKRMADLNNLDLSQVKGSGPGGRIVKSDIERALAERKAGEADGSIVKASGAAKRLAKEHQIDLAQLSGTGPGGRIVEADVLQAVEALARTREPAPAAASDGIPYQVISLSNIRRVAAQRMSESFQTAPHFYLNIELNISRLTELRKNLLPFFETQFGVRLTYSDILLRASALALLDHPLLNASWNDGEVRAFSEIHLGLAMATEFGLVVGVIHHTEKLSLQDVARQRQLLVEKAQERKLAPEDITGGTFTLTNLGMFGIDDFTPIINPPQSAILAAGAIIERPVAESSQLVLRPTLRLTLAVDHRVADGADGARFLQTLRGYLETPEKLFSHG